MHAYGNDVSQLPCGSGGLEQVLCRMRVSAGVGARRRGTRPFPAPSVARRPVLDPRVDARVPALRLVSPLAHSAVVPHRACRVFALRPAVELEARFVGGLGRIRIPHAPHGRVGGRLVRVPRRRLPLVPLPVLRKAVLQCFRHVGVLHVGSAGEVRDRAGRFSYPGAGAGGEAVRLCRTFQ